MAAMADNAFSYRLFGLRVRSELPLPELGPVTAAEAPDVRIVRGRVDSTGDEPFGLTVRGDSALLNIRGIGRFGIERGSGMTVEPAPGASERNVRLFLLGSAFAAILHQRGLLPLHANAVVVEGRAVAFMGHPGAGKSTLAAWFHDRGFPVLADDVCVVTWDEAGRPLANPGIPRLRLRPEAIEASGRNIGDYEPAFDDRDKFNVPTDRGGAREAVPLHHLYLLERSDSGGEDFDRLAGAAAVEALVANTYRGGYLPLMEGTGAHLLACARLARGVPVFEARRRWDLSGLDASSAALEAHARRLISGDPPA
jgi:hypothetical protein